ncbi:type VI toxin-antitoxin system SocA family antitoxin [Tabrizicola sp.]|uniref:type VI toxin-antitoxin system SocA family antitoxin n=1 Tax=Tabrizicola sp. TaxID=2005166 RepID=UPI003FCE43EF
MSSEGHDPRVVANFVLTTRNLIRMRTTQIELQKLLYFCHESYLIQNRKGLVSGYFEAWTHGPVHPDVYQAFKHFKGLPITDPAFHREVFTGRVRELANLSDPRACRHVAETVTRLSGLSARQLVDLSHIEGGPWHSIVESAKKGVALGLRITDDVILKHRTHSMLMRGEHQSARSGGVPDNGALTDEEVPITAGRPG